MEQDEQQLLIDVSVMYYLEGKTQNEIASALYLSRPKVSRLLKKSRELNLVEIKINYPNKEMEWLKNEIARRFKIKKVLVANTQGNYEETLSAIGKVAAQELEAVMKDDMTIGISWGKSVKSTITQLEDMHLKNTKIVELFGAFSYASDETNVLSIGNLLASKVGGKFFPLPAPFYIPDAGLRNVLLENPVVHNSLSMIRNCDLILTGLGAVDAKMPQVLWDYYVSYDLHHSIKDNGGVGFICAHFFDEIGQFLNIEINDNIIGIKTEDIRKHKQIFLVAGGETKIKAIHAALCGGYIHTLVSDFQTLKRIVEIEKELGNM